MNAAELSELFSREQQRLLGRLTRRLNGDRELAEDALAFAWVQLVGKRPEGNIAGWLYTVAKHEAFAELRRRRRAPQLAEPDLVLDEQADPAELVAERLCDQRALAALALLAAQQRLVLRLRGSGYSYAQITAATGKSYTWVNRHLSEGRRALRALLEAERGEE